ncbi:MAG: TetR/AcrR family transcriptional regulator [Proteobacteria bacterium]|nr:TetR/AcrR family transcriptional regulator [Pseudomonadota bacterium]MBU1741717.1 TetR/AcrR family transcriptional regulator [Pseudomonadota bacterium]
MPGKPGSTRPHRSLKTKGQSTRATLIEAAHEVFREKGYYRASVSEIARRRSLAQGTFYQYFKNKEQVFLELNDQIISRFWRLARAVPEKLEFRLALRGEVELLLDHTRENFAFHRILGESELIDRVTVSYYEAIARQIRDFFRRQAQAGHIRPIDPNLLAYALIGICYFHSLDWGPDTPRYDRDQLADLIVDIIINGIAGPAPWSDRPDLSRPPADRPPPPDPSSAEPLTKGELTRQAIFQAAEEVFGREGFSRANVAEITRLANVAQGTFYVHFESKTELMEGFVKFINRELRYELKRAASGVKDRREVEAVGLWHFYEFIRRRAAIYRVVPEFEMIGHDVGMWYYRKFGEGYREGLKQGIERGQIRPLPVPFLARSLMGLAHFIALEWIVWKASPKAALPEQLFVDLVQFVLFGLRGEE